MDIRIHGVPAALLRIVRDKAGSHLREVLIGLLRGYADGRFEPLPDPTGAGAARRRVFHVDEREQP